MFSLIPAKSYAFVDGSGWAIVAYVSKILYESYRRYSQLQIMIGQSQENFKYLRTVNSGLDTISGMIATLPMKDDGVLKGIGDFQKAVQTVDSIYGRVPKSGIAQMQSLHDQTIAESLHMTNNVQEYAKAQEENALKAFQMAGQMSPKGAERLAASTQAQVLHTLTQILKVNGELLKIHGESFAMSNKQDKDSVGGFNKINGDMKKSLGKFSGDFALVKF